MASVSAGHIIQTELVDRGLCLSQSHYTDRVGRLASVSAGQIIQTELEDRGLCLSHHIIQTDLGDRGLSLSRSRYTDRLRRPWPQSQPVTLYRQT